MRLWILVGCVVLVVAAAIFPFARRTEQLAPAPVTPAVAARLAAITNDAFARVRAERRSRFLPLATLPLCDPAASATELVRAMDELKLPGAMLFSNVNGTGLDHQQFWPLYEAANQRGAVMMIHPTYPLGVEAMREYWLMPLNGFLFDTTLAASKLVFSGVVKRYPRIRWVLGHLGGTIPYLAERLDRGWRAFKDCREHIDEPPPAPGLLASVPEYKDAATIPRLLLLVTRRMRAC